MTGAQRLARDYARAFGGERVHVEVEATGIPGHRWRIALRDKRDGAPLGPYHYGKSLAELRERFGLGK